LQKEEKEDRWKEKEQIQQRSSGQTKKKMTGGRIWEEGERRSSVKNKMKKSRSQITK
jgi:hypothetical protein